jgi:hypothetical protein
MYLKNGEHVIRSVKCHFRNITDGDKTKFSRSHCLLTISVGQEVHEDEHFKSTIELVNASFDSCIMLIDDSLQRHTMALASQKNADSFYQSSIEAGDQWLERNIAHYSQLTILKKIIRWNHWLQHPDFQAQQNKIKTLMRIDPSYKKAFMNTVDSFINRYYRRVKNKVAFDLNRAKQLCLDYLVEECAALCLWPETTCHFEVYPSRRNSSMDETHRRFVLSRHPNLLHALSIKFKNRKQLKPQQFPLNRFSDEEMVA